VQLEEEELNRWLSDLASKPKSEKDAELSSELLSLILSSQKKNLKACNGGSEEMLNDHKDVREKMTEVVELHAARHAMLERIMDLQDAIGAKIEMNGDDFDQLAEIQKRIHSRRV
jgi:DNA repair ATPase RecN